MTNEELKEILLYNPDEGSFYIIRDSIPYRRVFPNEDGYIIFFRNSIRYKLRASRIAAELGWGTSLTKDKIVLHLNLDERDYRLKNLRIIPRKFRREIKEAQRNLNGVLRLEPHRTNAYSYVLYWKEGNKERSAVIEDVVTAKRLLAKLQLKFSKILSKHCLFD